MVITLTLNPAVDKTIEIKDFKLNSVNRVTSSMLDAGGKGINVSKTISILQGKSKALGVLAGSTGNFIKKRLDELKIENYFLFIEGETRTNTKIVDPINGTYTDINERGPDISLVDLQKVINSTIEAVEKDGILVLSGSAPGNVSNTIYDDLIKAAGLRGAKTILDADGALLKSGIKASPYMIKPNINELSEFFDTNISTVNEAVKLARSIFEYGVKIIVISLGEKGAIFLTEDECITAEGLNIKALSTVGAGDAMVAAFAYAFERGMPHEEALILATATGAASALTLGTSPQNLSIVEDLRKQVKIKHIYD